MNLSRVAIIVCALLSAYPVLAEPQSPPKKTFVEFMTLRLMREKGVITEDEYQGAMRDLADSVGVQAEDSLSLVIGKWSTTLYGFAETDFSYDTTQSFSDLPGNTQVARPDSYAGNHGRFTASVRNSRLGFRLRAPEYHRVRASAVLEMDFFGSPPSTTESATFTQPGFRLRHGYLRLETPIIDVLVGQTWHLFGWQNTYHPATVEIQGVPSEVYSRTTQLRLSKTVKTSNVTFEAAVAMLRSPQRDSATPEGQAGVRLAFNKWTGTQTMGATGSTVSPLSVAVTADVRHFELAEFSATPVNSVPKTGWGVAADAFIPLLRGTKDKRSNSLSIQGEFAYGYGTADLYTQLNGGVTAVAPKLPNPMNLNPAPTYAPDVDPGLVAFAADGTLHLIQWTSYLVGAQYYFPKLDGRMWISAYYTHSSSNNANLYAAANAVRKGEDFVDGNLFGDVTPAMRLGLEYAWFDDHYADGKSAVNHRVQLSAFYLF